MEVYFERRETLTGAGYRWYETADFCRPDAGRDLRAQHNLGYWHGRDYLALGVGAVSTVRGRRWRTTPSVGRYLAALADGRRPERDVEELDRATRQEERVLLGLRLDEPLALDGLADAVDTPGWSGSSASGSPSGRRERSRSRRAAGCSAAGSPPRFSRNRPDGNSLHSDTISDCDRPHRTPAGGPAPRRRGVCPHRTAGRLEAPRRVRRSCASRPRPCVPSWPSSRRAGCSRTRTPRPAESRPTAATGCTSTG